MIIDRKDNIEPYTPVPSDVRVYTRQIEEVA